MRSEVVNVLALALVLGGVGISVAQTQPEKKRAEGGETSEAKAGKQKHSVYNVGELAFEVNLASQKSKLEAMLAQALKNNPDLRVAAAKLAEAEAELNRTRLQVTQKIVATYFGIETQKKAVAYQEAKVKRQQQLFQSGTIQPHLADEAQETLTLAKAKLAELEAQLPPLLGQEPNALTGSASSAAQAFLGTAKTEEATRASTTGYNPEAFALWTREREQSKVQGPLAERMRAALKTTIKVDYKEVAFEAVLKELEEKCPGLSFRGAERFKNKAVTFQFKEALPVSAILDALGDLSDRTFYVRSYGILVANGTNVPPGAMTISEFLRQKPKEAAGFTGLSDQSPNAGMLWNPPDNVEGTIKQIETSGFLLISFNRMDGLLSGHTLYLYRPTDGETRAKYLGAVRLSGVQKGKEVIGQPLGRLADTPRIGDKVTGHKPESR